MSNIPLPRLFDESLNYVRNIRPIMASVNLNIVPLSTASIQLPENESLPARYFVEVFTPLGSAGYFRVRSPQNTYAEGVSVSELEHAIVEVGDYLVLAKISEMMSPATAMATLFAHYSSKSNKWQLDTASNIENVLGTTNIAVQANYDSVLSCMLRVLNQIPDCMMTFNFETTPWTIGFAKVDDTVSAEGRLSRNVTNARITYDDSNLCTRVYYEFGGNLVYSDADTLNTYGLVEQRISIGPDNTQAEVSRIVNEYLRKHKKPKVSVEIGGIELSNRTGEPLDSFKLGKLFRLAMPDYNITIEEIIRSLSWSDVYGNPDSVIVSLADEEDTAVTYIHEQKNTISSVSKEQENIVSEVTESLSQIYTEIDVSLSSVYDDIIPEIEAGLSGFYDNIIPEIESGLSSIYDDIVPEIAASLSSVYDDIIPEIEAGLSGFYDDIIPEIEAGLSGFYDDIIPEIEYSLSGFYDDIEDNNLLLIELQGDVDDYGDILDQAGLSLDEDGNIQYSTDSGTIYSMAAEAAQSGIYSFVEDPETGLYSYLSQTASQIVSEVGDSVNQIYTNITQTASQIRAEAVAVGSSIASLTITASQIRSEVSNAQSDVASLTVEASQIRAEVSNAQNDVASFTVTANQIRSEVSDAQSNIASLTVEASQIRSEVSNAQSDMSSITQTANQIRAEVSNAQSQVASLSIEASQIRSEITDSVNGLQSSITQNANKIALVVDSSNHVVANFVKAEIVQEINKNGSDILINANRIKIGSAGNSNISLGDRISIDTSGNLYINANVYAGLTGNNYFQGTNYKIVGASSSQGANVYELNATSVSDMIIKAEVYNNTLYLWPYGADKTSRTAAGVLSFSKATTLSGAWDSGTYTVTASPQGNTRSTTLQIITPVPNSTITRSGKSVSRQFKVQYGPNESSLSDTGFTQTISIDATSVFNYGKSEVTLNDPTWNAISGAIPSSRSVTVTTSGRTNSSGAADNLSKNVSLYLVNSGLTVYMRAGSTSGTTYAQTTCSDSNLSAGNIKSGVSIFGVTGSYAGTGGSVTESDISIKSQNFGERSASLPSGYYSKLDNNSNASITLSNTTGYYTFIVDAKGTPKWYKIYIDGSALASSSITSVTAGTSLISWDSTNKKFYNYGYAYTNGSSQPAATSPKRESSALSIGDDSWSNGTKKVWVKHGSSEILSDTVSMPAVSETTWENTSGNYWRTRLTIGGVYRYSSTKEFAAGYTQEQYDQNFNDGYNYDPHDLGIYDENGVQKTSVTVQAGGSVDLWPGFPKYKANGSVWGTKCTVNGPTVSAPENNSYYIASSAPGNSISDFTSGATRLFSNGWVSNGYYYKFKIGSKSYYFKAGS